MRPLTTIACRFVMALVALVTLTGLVEGQRTEITPGVSERRRTEIMLSIGPQLSDNDDEKFGSARGRLEIALQRSVMSRVRMRFAIAGSLLGPPPCPQPPWEKGAWIQTMPIGRSLEGLLDVGLSLPIGRALSLEPYAGFGARYLTDGETKGLLPGAYAVSSSTRPLVSGGLTAYTTITERVRGFARFRLSRHFMGTQTLTPLDGESIKGEMPDLDTGSLTGGLAFRF